MLPLLFSPSTIYLYKPAPQSSMRGKAEGDTGEFLFPPPHTNARRDLAGGGMEKVALSLTRTEKKMVSIPLSCLNDSHTASFLSRGFFSRRHFYIKNTFSKTRHLPLESILSILLLVDVPLSLSMGGSDASQRRKHAAPAIRFLTPPSFSPTTTYYFRSVNGSYIPILLSL